MRGDKGLVDVEMNPDSFVCTVTYFFIPIDFFSCFKWGKFSTPTKSTVTVKKNITVYFFIMPTF